MSCLVTNTIMLTQREISSDLNRRVLSLEFGKRNWNLEVEEICDIDLCCIFPGPVVHRLILLISVNLQLSISKLLQVDLAQIFDSTFEFWFYALFFGSEDTAACQSRQFFAPKTSAPLEKAYYSKL